LVDPPRDNSMAAKQRSAEKICKVLEADAYNNP